MKISELSRKTNCDVETIRYYEKAGLLPAPRRLDNGYRAYSTQHLEQLQFIRHCRSLQMGLSDIRILLDLKSRPSIGCEKVDALLEGHIARTREQIAQLSALESQLHKLREQCQGTPSTRECGILQHLKKPSDEQACACHDPEDIPAV